MPAPHTLLIALHQEKLPGNVIGVQLTLGLLQDTTSDPALPLKPWQWNMITEWDVYDAATDPPMPAGSATTIPPISEDYNVGLLQDALETRLTGSEQKWPAVPSTVQTVNRDQHALPTYLAEWARLPYPYPHALNLAFVVGRDTSFPAQAIIVPRTLSGNGAGAVVFTRNDVSKIGPRYKVTYNPTLTNDTTVELRTDVATPHPAPTLIDLSTLWITPPMVTDENWQLSFEDRLSEAWDLPRILLDKSAPESWLVAALKRLLGPPSPRLREFLGLQRITPGSPVPRENWLDFAAETLPDDSAVQAFRLEVAADRPVSLDRRTAFVAAVTAPQNVARLIAGHTTAPTPELIAALAASPALRLQKRGEISPTSYSQLYQLLDTPPVNVDTLKAKLLERLIAYAIEVSPITLSAELQVAMDRYADQVVKESLLSALQEGQDTSPLPTAHDLILQVDRLGPQNQDADFLTHLNGVAILMRRKVPNTPWYCLHAAALARADGKPFPPEPGTHLVVAHSVLTYQNNERQAFLTYAAQPLGAESPLARLVKRETRGEPETPILYRFMAIDYTVTPAQPLVLLPSLKFGDTYEYAPFVVGIGGGKPESIRGAHPASYNAAFTGPIATAQTVEYQRRVPVGEPLIENPKAAFPRLEDQVEPLSLEIASPPLPLVIPGVAPVSDRELPLRVLGIAQSFEIKLCRPRVDWKTWDRWPLQGLTTPQRVDVMSYCHTNLDTANTSVLLDDPATDLSLRIEAVLFRTDGSVENTQATLVMVGDPEGPMGAPAFRRQPGTLTVKTGTFGAAGSTITVPAGRVVEIRVYARVPAADRDQCFAGAWGTPDNQAGFVRMAPLVLRVEAATEVMPTVTELYAALLTGFDGTHAKATLQSTAANLAYVGKFEARVQEWKWSGRSLKAPFPVDQMGNPGAFATALTKWDADGFGDVSDTTYERFDTLVTWKGLRNDGVMVWEEDVSADLRLLYRRIGGVAHSRYRGILGDKARRVVAQSAESMPDTAYDLWKRVVVPCRRPANAPLPPPRLKLLLPLTTRSDEASTVTADLMAVLTEAAYEYGGLAEKYTVYLMPNEAGADPLRSLIPVTTIPPGQLNGTGP